MAGRCELNTPCHLTTDDIVYQERISKANLAFCNLLSRANNIYNEANALTDFVNESWGHDWKIRNHKSPHTIFNWIKITIIG